MHTISLISATYDSMQSDPGEKLPVNATATQRAGLHDLHARTNSLDKVLGGCRRPPPSQHHHCSLQNERNKLKQTQTTN